MTESCICGVWKELCPELAIDFEGFDLPARLLEERLELVRKVSLDELEEEYVNSLLDAIGEELSTEELDELEKQRYQLEEEVEARQHPMSPSTTKVR